MKKPTTRSALYPVVYPSRMAGTIDASMMSVNILRPP